MAEAGWLHHAIQIGTFEFRRTLRAVWQDKARFALMAIGVLIPSLIFGAFAVIFTDAIREFDAGAVPTVVRGMIALFWLFGVFLTGQRVVSARTRIDAEPLLLTTVSARTVAGGLLLAELGRVLAYASMPTLILTGAATYLFQTPLPVIVVPATVLLFAATTVVTGAVCGYAVAWLVATSPFVAQHKTILGTAASFLAMGGYFVFLSPEITGVSQAALAWLPMGWFADLAVVGTPFTGSIPQLLGVLLSSGLVILLGGAIIERETTALWFTDPVSPTTADTTTADTQTTPSPSPATTQRDALARAIAPIRVPQRVSPPVRRVAEWTLMRTRREPNKVMIVLLPIIAMASPLLETGHSSGALFALLAPLYPVLMPWLAGAIFAINPFGDEGPVLPLTLTAVAGTHYVRGLILPSILLGLPLSVLGTALLGSVSPYTLNEQVSLIGLSVYLTGVAAALTPAIGMALPRFSAIRVGQSQKVLPPRLTAVGLHFALTAIPGLLLAGLITVPQTVRAILAGLFGTVPAVVLRWLSRSEHGLLQTGATWVTELATEIQNLPLIYMQGIGGGVILLGGVGTAVLLYRHAVRRFNRYSPPN